MSAILGGLFNSRLNMKLREEKGYTYGASAGFDLRRGCGPFTARAAVNTEVTVPALHEFLAELDRIREAPGDGRGAQGRPRLPRRRVPAPVRDAGPRRRVARRALRPRPARRRAGPLPRRPSRPSTAEDVLRVAREHIRPEAAAIVLVGDHDAFGEALEAAAIGPVEVIRDADPVAPAAED